MAEYPSPFPPPLIYHGGIWDILFWLMRGNAVIRKLFFSAQFKSRAGIGVASELICDILFMKPGQLTYSRIPKKSRRLYVLRAVPVWAYRPLSR